MDKRNEKAASDALQKSIIPAIREEETRLGTIVTDAKTEAAGLVEQAQREAGELVRDTEQTLGEWIRAQQDGRVGQVQADVEHHREGRAGRVGELEAVAARNMDAAVARILDDVWGPSA